MLTMTELTDLEICKRIAEIEGIDYSFHKAVNALAYTDEFDEVLWYNPLTDKALCFALIEQWIKEFGIDIHLAYKEHPCTYAVDTGFSVIFNDSLAKAVCLARIEIRKRGDRI